MEMKLVTAENVYALGEIEKVPKSLKIKSEMLFSKFIP